MLELNFFDLGAEASNNCFFFLYGYTYNEARAKLSAPLSCPFLWPNPPQLLPVPWRTYVCHLLR